MLADKKVRLAALLVVTVFSVAVSGTLAYFVASTLSIKNDFYPAKLNIVIHEQFEQTDGGYVKSNVTVENVVVPNATSRAYIRVKLVPTWRDANGNVAGVPAPVLPAPPDDISFVLDGISGAVNSNLAFDYIDGYYYYKGILKPGESTPSLIQSITVDYGAYTGTQYEGLTLELSVLAEGLDSNVGAPEAAWGMTYHESPSPGYWSYAP